MVGSHVRRGATEGAQHFAQCPDLAWVSLQQREMVAALHASNIGQKHRNRNHLCGVSVNESTNR
ncbi:hypothetical protein Ga0080559_TMP5233 (plasmid) [Salipiger profundus]|uniref:Uncharacterized protein n=1 Tax=Salipiger profundus TaxID=1229727 RepID=A0A1U7DDY8_9RHOB|nr:hypothetical protein Ga0080559_TMP5233 [Salipiger profundus]